MRKKHVAILMTAAVTLIAAVAVITLIGSNRKPPPEINVDADEIESITIIYYALEKNIFYADNIQFICEYFNTLDAEYIQDNDAEYDEYEKVRKYGGSKTMSFVFQYSSGEKQIGKTQIIDYEPFGSILPGYITVHIPLNTVDYDKRLYKVSGEYFEELFDIFFEMEYEIQR